MFEKVFRKIQLPSQNRKGSAGRKAGYIPTASQLKALRNHGVPEKAVLNPYGCLGDCRRARYRATWFKRELKPAYREKAMKRKRVMLKEKRALALEAHELQQLAREHASVAMQTLIEISKNPRAPEATRISASSVILDRAYGKASQTSITANVTSSASKDLSASELDNRVAKALKKVEELTNKSSKISKINLRKVDLKKLN